MIADQKEAVEKYLEEVSHKSDLERTDLAKDKTGVFTGSYAIDPVNGAKVPIWIADYVLASYGTGAVMVSAAHDPRDWEFAKKYDIPMIQVIAGGDITKEAYTGEEKYINSGFLDGLEDKEKAIELMIEWLKEHHVGDKKVNYRLRDWTFSRQRYCISRSFIESVAFTFVTSEPFMLNV